MGEFINLAGKRYGRLIVTKLAEPRRGQVHWECRCDCGSSTIVRGSHLRDGGTRSCGCGMHSGGPAIPLGNHRRSTCIGCGGECDVRALRCKACNDKRPDEKPCTGCDRTLPIDSFYVRSSGGLVSRCKECIAREQKSRTGKREAHLRRWPATRLRNLRRRQADPQFRLSKTLPGLIRSAIKKGWGTKAFRTTVLLGCSVPEFVAHIEANWRLGMTWENWGKGHGKWQLDHVVPVSHFNLSEPDEQRLCFHYTNYQPLWHVENASKSNRYVGAFRPDAARVAIKVPA